MERERKQSPSTPSTEENRKLRKEEGKKEEGRSGGRVSEQTQSFLSQFSSCSFRILFLRSPFLPLLFSKLEGEAL